MGVTAGQLKATNITAAATSAGYGQAPDQRRLYDFGDRVAELSPPTVRLGTSSSVPRDRSRGVCYRILPDKLFSFDAASVLCKWLISEYEESLKKYSSSKRYLSDCDPGDEA